MIRSTRRTLSLAAGIALALIACGDSGSESARKPEAEAPAAKPSPEGVPPTAKLDVARMLEEDLAAKRSPSDGGGRAWLEPTPEGGARVKAGTSASFRLVYEVGPLGIAQQGGIYLQISPFWGWSTPQVEDTDAPGYTTLEASADDIELDAKTLGPQMLGIEVVGRALVAGERVTLVYGAGPPGATTDRFAERGSRFWFAVDGDGDGIRAVLPDSPEIEVLAGDPARLEVTLPGVARPGERVAVTLALLDRLGNAGAPVEAVIRFPDPPPGLELPPRVKLTAADRGHKTILALAREPGIVRLHAEGPNRLSAESNPLLISRDGPRVLWGDLHGHSNFSDGTGTPEDYFLYARDVAGLDVAALTDHDHWGMLPLDAEPGMWDEIQHQTRRFHEPGRFVTLLGYEWTSWIQGHRHVLHFEDHAKLLSSLDPDYASPVQLWRALEGRPALTFAHHSAGGPIATNWAIPPDPVLEPITEIASVHGSSEAADSPRPIYDPVAGNYVRDALGRGYRFGFIGSGDSHDGHPGLTQIASLDGGMAAILSEERTREGVLAALRARRVYATNGPRILLRTALGAHPMGSSVTVPPGGSASETLFVSVISPGPLARVDLIRSGRVADSFELAGERDATLERRVENLRPGEYVYVRAVQRDGGAAWSSPIYID
ncbi:MAG: CehA/McbA family metallohydrolase [Candidatus Limnocylindria bacterium]